MNNYRIVRKTGETMYILACELIDEEGILTFHDEEGTCTAAMDSDEVACVYSEPVPFSECVFQDGKMT